MKHRELVKLLERHGIVLLRHGARHDIYLNPATGKTQGVPRHKEIKEVLAENILTDFGIIWRKP
ncbi:MAG: type II toxin-antitoxin system HicA family toxin [Pleurocapsa sp. SU_196_0]|nr:type II toxin-antitoxin system HicA family toxin [Pleurocapsa sp. SU_196_0]